MTLGEQGYVIHLQSKDIKTSLGPDLVAIKDFKGLSNRSVAFLIMNENSNLCIRSKAMDGGNSDEAEALIQVFIGGASFQQGEGDEV